MIHLKFEIDTWMYWSDWGECRPDCNSGKKVRSRECAGSCPTGESEQIENCNGGDD